VRVTASVTAQESEGFSLKYILLSNKMTRVRLMKKSNRRKIVGYSVKRIMLFNGNGN